ncbi:MAG TPA: hypothetical protein PKZ84_15025 [Anaerolineae bacterium]|nr:hypothetical protein [Anaerolineae bacterium]HQI85775.1 hypothetical protein [Anaerolineae bacterium]
MLSEEFKLHIDHIEKLLDRRQTTTSFYLSVNTGIFAVIGFLIKDAQLVGFWLVGSIALLLIAGLIACWIWRSLLRQYEILLDWWYARLRELEAESPDSAKLITREYEDLYLAAKRRKPSKRIGMTQRELALNWVLTGLYIIFAAGLIVSFVL